MEILGSVESLDTQVVFQNMQNGYRAVKVTCPS